MPNVKIYVDETLWADRHDALGAVLAPLRDLLCRELSVDVPACQFAVLPVMAMADLPRVNVEIAILPRPERTRDLVTALGRQVQALVAEAAGTHAAVRVSALDPVTYVALK